jgi:hypothetical protein
MQIIDENISKSKFEFELDKFRKLEDNQRKRGIILLKAEFPNIVLAFSAIHLTPPPTVFAVKINFDNYDIEPLSIRFINPFTFEELITIPIGLNRKKILSDGSVEIIPLAQQDKTSLPFVCMPGVREYHAHPAHTGDYWLLHRNIASEGSMGFIIEKLYEYGVSAIRFYNILIKDNDGNTKTLLTQMMNLSLKTDIIPV